MKRNKGLFNKSKNMDVLCPIIVLGASKFCKLSEALKMV